MKPERSMHLREETQHEVAKGRQRASIDVSETFYQVQYIFLFSLYLERQRLVRSFALSKRRLSRSPTSESYSLTLLPSTPFVLVTSPHPALPTPSLEHAVRHATARALNALSARW